MATNKTPNLGLSQWVRSDGVIMDEFNENNRKIDEAVAEVRQEVADVSAAVAGSLWVKLMDVTVNTSGITALELNLSELDLKKYFHLRLFKDDGNVSSTIYCRLNKYTSSYEYMPSNSPNWQSTSATCASSNYGAMDFYLNVVNVTAVDLKTAGYRTTAEVIKPATFKTIDLIADSGGTGKFTVGTRFVLLGVRK